MCEVSSTWREEQKRSAANRSELIYYYICLFEFTVMFNIAGFTDFQISFDVPVSDGAHIGAGQPTCTNVPPLALNIPEK